MISYLQGEVVKKEPTNLLIDVGGIGYSVKIPLSSYEKLGQSGEQVKVFTYLSVRDNNFELFGFATQEEKNLFEILIKVPGIGLKLAQSILSTVSVEDFRRSLIEGDLEGLMVVPGIGKKSAKRLLFELKEQFTEEGLITLEENRIKDKKGEAISALVSLGYKRSNAKETVDELIKREGSDLSLEEIIKKALNRINRWQPHG